MQASRPKPKQAPVLLSFGDEDTTTIRERFNELQVKWTDSYRQMEVMMSAEAVGHLGSDPFVWKMSSLTSALSLL